MSTSFPRPLPSHLRTSSQSLSGSAQSSALQSRIAEKKQELASLKELQALSAGLADQMEQLELKLGTLSDGTEAVAVVLSNWGNVLRAIGMASSKLPKPKDDATADTPQLPQTLVRIPTQHAGMIPQEDTGNSAGV